MSTHAETTRGAGCDLGTVTALIGTYNYGRFVCDAVDSALGQTYPALEIIVVDDGSTDDTRQRLEKYGERIRYLHQENRGISAARNTGLRAARGDWVAFLDADDWWHPEKTAFQLRAAVDNGFDALRGWRLATREPIPLPTVAPVTRASVKDWLTGLTPFPSGQIVRRRCLDSVGGFDESLRAAEDRDLMARLATRFVTGCLDAGLAWYREHDAQLSNQMETLTKNYLAALAKFFAEHPDHVADRKPAYALLHLDAAMGHMDSGERVQAAKHIVRSLSLHPWEPMTPMRRRLSTKNRLKALARSVLGDGATGLLRRRRAPTPSGVSHQR